MAGRQGSSFTLTVDRLPAKTLLTDTLRSSGELSVNSSESGDDASRSTVICPRQGTPVIEPLGSSRGSAGSRVMLPGPQRDFLSYLRSIPSEEPIGFPRDEDLLREVEL